MRLNISASAKFVGAVSLIFTGLTVSMVTIQASSYRQSANEEARRSTEQVLTILEQTIFVLPELFHPDTLANIIERFAKVSENIERISITDHSGTIIVDSDRSRLARQSDFPTAAMALRTGLPQAREFTPPESDLDHGGVEHYEISHLLLGRYDENRKSNVLGIATFQSRQTTMNDLIVHDLAGLLAIIFAVFSVCGVLIYLALRGLVVRPLRMLVQATDQFGKGDWSRRVKVRREDELGQLARTFNVMAENLQREIDEREEQIAMRTARVEAQAQDLREALAGQIEYNNLQREFVSLASHEFRTPLTIIDGTASRIIRKADQFNPEKIRERCGDIRNAVARMIGLIESTLSAERMEAGKIKFEPQPVNLTELLETVQRRQQEISPSHQIRLDIQNFPNEIRGDPQLLEQTFANLLSNAAKYSLDGSQIEVVGRMEGNKALVTVRDHGVGIPADELPRVFQRYFRARTAIGIAGTGIGLYVVRRFVGMHGGSVQAESVEGEGSTFTVQLPISRSEEQAADNNDSHDPHTQPEMTSVAWS